MSHSKRNTSLAFFTAHERSQVRAHWGSQSTRLTRDSFLPFGYCRLCLGVARDPVTCGGVSITSNTSNNKTESSSSSSSSSSCPKVHIFCRECALNDLVSQRREIKRVEKSVGERGREEAMRKADEAEEKRRQDVERFERANLLGFALGDDDEGGGGGLKKRKREARELHSSSSVGSSTNTDGNAKRTTAAIDDNDNDNGENHKEKKNKNKSSEASFWIPSTSTTAATAADGNHAIAKPPPKQHPICPASTPSTPHIYSLKTLITVHFTEEGEGEDEGGRNNDNPPSASTATSHTRICPSCKKALTNTSRAMLGATASGDKCGHVVCGNCVDLFRSVPSSGSGSGSGIGTKPVADIRCYVCEADLNGGAGASNETETEGEKNSENGHDKGKVKHNSKSKSSQQLGGRLLEISCEGTGFAGGGANMAKREGVSFQC